MYGEATEGRNDSQWAKFATSISQDAVCGIETCPAVFQPRGSCFNFTLTLLLCLSRCLVRMPHRHHGHQGHGVPGGSAEGRPSRRKWRGFYGGACPTGISYKSKDSYSILPLLTLLNPQVSYLCDIVHILTARKAWLRYSSSKYPRMCYHLFIVGDMAVGHIQQL